MSSFFARAFSFMSSRSRTRSSSSDQNSTFRSSSTSGIKKEDTSSLFRRAAAANSMLIVNDQELKQQQIRETCEVGKSCDCSTISDDCHARMLREFSRSTCSTVLIQEDECVLCLDEFTSENPQICTLCSCGENRTKFHYPCLLMWLEKKPVCPTCDAAIFFQEGVYHYEMEE